MSYLKLTNTGSFLNGPLVINTDKILCVFPITTDNACYVATTSSEIDSPNELNAGKFTITGDSYVNFAEEINNALTANPGGPVIKLHTKAQITNYEIQTS